jgi:hypothetical protein
MPALDGCGHLQVLAALPRRMCRRYPLSRRLVGHQKWSQSFAEENNLFPVPGMETWFISFPIRSLGTIPTELTQFLHDLNN